MEMENTSGLNRRDFAKGALALGGAGLLSAVTLGASRNGGLVFAQSAPFKDDIDILNYALTLEYFEATLYVTLRDGGKLQGRDLQYITLFAGHEQAHVDAVHETIIKLGGTPVQKAEYNFPTLNTREEVLNLLNVVEQTGIGAYLGAAIYIQNKDILAAAASIMQVEARHTALIRFLLGLPPVPDAFTPGFTPDEVLKKVAPFFKS